MREFLKNVVELDWQGKEDRLFILRLVPLDTKLKSALFEL
jgi:hypothetical protein